MKHLLIAATLAMGAFATGLYFGHHDTPEQSSPAVEEALQTLQQIPLTTLDGATTDLAPWRGKILVINYWATWCPPCRREMPEFSRLQDEFSSRGVQFIGIAMDAADNVRDFVAKTPVNYPLLIAHPAVRQVQSPRTQPLAGLPFTLIVDREGKVRQQRLGEVRGEEIADLLRSLL